MKELVKRMPSYTKIRWAHRLSSLVFLVMFLTVFVPEVTSLSMTPLEIIIIFMFIISYIITGLAVLPSNLVNAALMVVIAIVFEFHLYLVHDELNLLSVYILYVPGFMTLLWSLFNHESYMSIDSRIKELEQKHKISLEMMAFTPDIITNTDLDDMLQKLLEKAVKIMPKAQMGSILIRDGDVMKFRAAVGYDLDMLKKIDMRLDEMFQYKQGIINEPSIMHDIKTFNKENLQFKKYHMMEEGNANIAKSILTAPIRLNDRLYGFINLDNNEDYHAFDEKDKIYIAHLANQIDIAIHNHELVDDIYELSRHDKLTETYTRQYNQELLTQLIKEAQTDHSTFTIAIIDLNDLKQINDTYGHVSGDRYLRHFTYIVRKNISKNTIFARMGGDEFILTMPYTTPLEAAKIIEKIRGDFSKRPLKYDQKDIPVSFACGFSVYPKDGKTIEHLIQVADKHMYQDKQQHKRTNGS